MKRNALIFSLAVVMLAGFVAPSLLAQDAKPFLGDWKGPISVEGMEIEIVLHFTLNAEKKIAGTIDVPTQGATGLALGEIKVEGKTISFTIPDAPGGAAMKGTLDAAGKVIKGTLSQGGAEGTFTATKI